MNNKKIDLLYGILIAVAASFLGMLLLIKLLTHYSLIEGIQTMQARGKLGKVIALGAVLNVLAFFILLRYKKEMMARGVVLGTIILTVFTLVI